MKWVGILNVTQHKYVYNFKQIGHTANHFYNLWSHRTQSHPKWCICLVAKNGAKFCNELISSLPSNSTVITYHQWRPYVYVLHQPMGYIRAIVCGLVFAIGMAWMGHQWTKNLLQNTQTTVQTYRLLASIQSVIDQVNQRCSHMDCVNQVFVSDQSVILKVNQPIQSFQLPHHMVQCNQRVINANQWLYCRAMNG